MKINAIMNAAHAMTRDTLREFPAADYRATLRAALRICWSESGKGEAVARRAADAIRAEFRGMSGEDVRAFCARCVRRAAKNEIGYSIEDQYAPYWEIPAFGCTLDDLTDETWMKAAEAVERYEADTMRRAAQGKAPRTLASVIYNAAHAAIMAVYRAERKHGVASVRIVEVDDGATVDAVEQAAASDNTERAALIRAALAEVRESLDTRDAVVLQGIMDGATLAAIADRCGISIPAAKKRRDKLLATLRDYIDA